MIRIVIPNPPVTKKNSQRIIRLKNGRPSIRPSALFERYQEGAGYSIPEEARKQLSGPHNVKGVYYMPTRRMVDLLNLLEATCDILVHYGVLEDDNSGIVWSHDGSRVRYDKEHPRAEIEITPICCGTCLFEGTCFNDAAREESFCEVWKEDEGDGD